MIQTEPQTRVSGTIIDPLARRVFKGHVHCKNGLISTIEEDSTVEEQHYILPPLVDAHIHIESSMLTPSAWAEQAICHGTGAVVADPHEIANVLGVAGIDFMIKDAGTVPLAFYFGAPSCVPATPFESAGAMIDAETTASLMERDDIYFLGEMMNFPGVIHSDPQVMAKINHARANNKPVDGHAPSLSENDLDTYIKAGISTDHEATTLKEALEKIDKGMKILIRNGSSAKDFTALHSLISSHPRDGMLCSDDLHPDDLLQGHLNLLVKKSLQAGHDILDILQYSSVNPVHHYNLRMGLLQPGDPADFIIIDDPHDFNVLAHYAGGKLVAKHNTPLFSTTPPPPLNNFKAQPQQIDALQVPATAKHIQVMEVTDGDLITGKFTTSATSKDGFCLADPERDLLKICVLNRYKAGATPAMGFVAGFGLQRGAMASSIAHDSHNIIAIGCNDEDLLDAINEVIRCQGGISYTEGGEKLSLPLPVAGLMGLGSCAATAEQHHRIELRTKKNGCKLHAPFMAMSFLALPVIPHLKITDQGLFDVDSFAFTPLFQESIMRSR